MVPAGGCYMLSSAVVAPHAAAAAANPGRTKRAHQAGQAAYGTGVPVRHRACTHHCTKVTSLVLILRAQGPLRHLVCRADNNAAQGCTIYTVGMGVLLTTVTMA
jgi:hypothetical protein